jgi:hypothetical protein
MTTETPSMVVGIAPDDSNLLCLAFFRTLSVSGANFVAPYFGGLGIGAYF